MPSPFTFAGLAAIALWGLLALFTTATAGIPPFQLTALTFGISGTLFTLLVLARGHAARLRQPLMAWALGVGGLFGFHALYFSALKLAPAAEANLVNYLWPLLIVLFSALLPGERLKRQHVLGALLGFAGVAALSLGGTRFSIAALPGYLAALGCAFVWAGYSVLSRRMAQVPTEAVAGFCLVSSALAALCHRLFEATVMPAGPGVWLAIVALGLGPAGGAFFLWDLGMKRGDIRFLGVAAYAAPVISTLALVIAGAAESRPTLWLACGLIVAGAVVATRR